MKFAAISLLAGSAAAFAPVQQSGRTVVSLNAERSKSLPFMNRPPLVSFLVVLGWKEVITLGLKRSRGRRMRATLRRISVLNVVSY